MNVVVQTELERIKSEQGALRPEDVVASARPKTSPLHGLFTWDNREAGEAHRLNEARSLIRSVRIKVEKAKGNEIEDISVRRWVAPSRVGLGPDEGYQAEEDVRAHPEMRAVLLKTMEREIGALHRRYRHLHEYWEVLDELSARRDTA